jgi:hypothetical protein
MHGLTGVFLTNLTPFAPKQSTGFFEKFHSYIDELVPDTELFSYGGFWLH